MTRGVTRAPTPTDSAAMLSSSPKTLARTCGGAIRAMRVNAPRSMRALPAPTTASMTMADVAEGTSPMTTIGAPQSAAPSPNQAASRLVPTRSAAATDATTAPAPSAALSTPTPGSPSPTSSIATTAVNTVTAPRMKVWALARARSSLRSRCSCTARTPARVLRSALSPTSALPTAAGSGWTRAMSSAAQRRRDGRDDEHPRRTRRGQQDGADGGTGQRGGRVERAPHDVGARELGRRVAEGRQQRRVHRPEEHRGGRGQRDEGVDDERRPVDEHGPRRPGRSTPTGRPTPRRAPSRVATGRRTGWRAARRRPPGSTRTRATTPTSVAPPRA